VLPLSEVSAAVSPLVSSSRQKLIGESLKTEEP
jgi:hypothetical protein